MSAPYKYLSTLSNNPSSSGSLQPAMLRLVIYNNNLQSDHWMAVSVVTRRCHNISLTSDQINVRNTQHSPQCGLVQSCCEFFLRNLGQVLVASIDRNLAKNLLALHWFRMVQGREADTDTVCLLTRLLMGNTTFDVDNGKQLHIPNLTLKSLTC